MGSTCSVQRNLMSLRIKQSWGKKFKGTKFELLVSEFLSKKFTNEEEKGSVIKTMRHALARFFIILGMKNLKKPTEKIIAVAIFSVLTTC